MSAVQRVLAHLDLGGTAEIRNVVLGSDVNRPANPAAGHIFFNSVSGRVEYYDGAAWQTLAAEVFTEAAHDDLDHSAIASTIALNELGQPTGVVNFAGVRLTNVGTPTDAADAANKGYVDAAASDAAADLATETAARTSADTALQSAIDDVVADLTSEVSRATAAEAALQATIDSLDTNYASQAEIDAEAAARAAADTTLQSNIDAVAGDVTAVEGALADEADARAAADAALQSAIDAEAVRATAAEAGIQSQIDALDTTYASEEDLSSAIVFLDTQLRSSINDVANDLLDEADLRTAADATLQSGIDAVAGDLSDEVTRATAAEGVIASDLASEVSRATAAEAALASDISDETTRALAAEAVLDSRLDTVETTIETLATSQELTDAIAQEVIDRNAAIASAEAALEAAIADGLNGLDHKLSVKAATTEALAGVASSAGTTFTVSLKRDSFYLYVRNGSSSLGGTQLISASGVTNALIQNAFTNAGTGLTVSGAAVTAGGDFGYGVLTFDVDGEFPAGYNVRLFFPDNTSEAIMTATAQAGASSAALSGLKTIDGVSLVAGDRVLVKDQGTAADNGIYVVSASDWVRAADADGTDLNAGAFTFVEGGTANGSSGFVLLSSGAWTQFSGAGQITAGAGLTKTGNTLAVSTGNGLKVENDQVQLDGPVSIANGGTGATTEAGARTALNVPSRYATTVGDGSATAYVVTHNLGTKDVICALRTVADDELVMASVTASSTSTVTVEFATAPAANAVRVVVIG